MTLLFVAKVDLCTRETGSVMKAPWLAQVLNKYKKIEINPLLRQPFNCTFAVYTRATELVISH